jgi:hypothetical protein
MRLTRYYVKINGLIMLYDWEQRVIVYACVWSEYGCSLLYENAELPDGNELHIKIYSG